MNYWQKRIAEQQLLLYDKSAKQLGAELARCYSNTLSKLKSEIVSLYDEILVDTQNGTLLVSDLYRYNRYYDLISNLSKEMNSLGLKENSLFSSKLTKMYNQNAETIGRSLHINTAPNPILAEQTVHALWCSDGVSWSDRVWRDKKLLVNRLEQSLVDCAAKGATSKQLAAQLVKDFGTAYNNAERIARTELSFVQTQSTMDKYSEAGVEYYEIYDTEDDRECDLCADMDGKRYPLNQAQVGVNCPPFHPNCRCCVLAVID